MERFYVERLGLEMRPRRAGANALGAPGGADILELEFDAAAAARSPRSPGLFHYAILVPTRADLGVVIRELLAARYPLDGLSDHGVSEALYLRDPEGNGIEIYADRPRAEWPGAGSGRVEMYTRAGDLDGLLEEAGSLGWSGFHAATRLGHVHLQASDLAASEPFYAGALGLDVTTRDYPGALFLARGGYHHHVGLNVWQSRGAPAAPESATGLTAVRFYFADGAAAVCERLERAGFETAEIPGGWRTRDPSGIPIEILR